MTKSANQKTQVSIGIPAHNEEINIIKLIVALLEQKRKSYDLKEIIVISDGSNDNTVRNIHAINNKLIKAIDAKKRMGQNFRQNQIIGMFKGDVIVFAEADTLPENDMVVENLVSEFRKHDSKKLAAVVGWYKPATPKGFYQKITYAGDRLKKNIYKSWKNGNNIYWLGGHSIKALSRNFAKELNLPLDVAEDAYIYLRSKTLGYEFIMIDNANMYGGMISDFPDQVKQSNKFISGVNSIEKYFSKDVREKEYNIPKTLLLKEILAELIKNRLWTSLYILTFVLNRLFSHSKNTLNPKYKEYKSTKKILRN